MRIGIVGAGQLGRMLALAGIPMGMHFTFLDPDPEACAAELGHVIAGRFDDPVSLNLLASQVDLITFDFENVASAVLKALADGFPVHPDPQCLFIAQDRLLEKQFLASVGIATSGFWAIDSLAELQQGVLQAGRPCILKTRRFGYDGKGQFLIDDSTDLEALWETTQRKDLILEQWINFERELSLVSVRARNGEVRHYSLTENEHVRGVLSESHAPAPETESLQLRAQAHAEAIFEKFEYCGVLAVEYFQRDGQLIANEIAPRVHNSGHWTIEGAVTSQFENHLRAISGLPLGATENMGHSAMLNLIGCRFSAQDFADIAGVHLHDYAKTGRSGRKMGHVTANAPGRQRLEKVLAEMRSRVLSCPEIPA